MYFSIFLMTFFQSMCYVANSNPFDTVTVNPCRRKLPRCVQHNTPEGTAFVNVNVNRGFI